VGSTRAHVRISQASHAPDTRGLSEGVVDAEGLHLRAPIVAGTSNGEDTRFTENFLLRPTAADTVPGRLAPHELDLDDDTAVGYVTCNDQEWHYVNVRRLFAFIQESIAQGTRWVVLEPNSPILWIDMRLTIEMFLRTLWKKGALVGSTPQEAFFVRCDRTTMTQKDVDAGRLVALVGVALVQPAEFVIIRITAHT